MPDSVSNIPPGWCRDAHGALRRETIHSMLRRLPGWDYCKPWIYQITLVCANRKSAPLGQIVVRGGNGEWLSLAEARGSVKTPEEVAAKVEPTAMGAEILALFLRFPEFTPEIRPIQCEIMPDHIHFIVRVMEEMKRPLGNAIGGFKTGCEKLFRAAGGEGRLFAEGFQDTILFRDGQLANMFHYLADNPRRRAIKALFPELFRVVGELAVPLRLSPREPDVADRAVPRARARGWFAALGNRFLLERPLAQVQVSRSDFRYKRIAKPGGGLKIERTAEGEPIVESASPGYAEKKAMLFAAAKHGAVLISPCVSDGERQIAREALAAGFPLVTLQNKGFSPLQKPSGRYFDACAEGRLLMLAPAAWPFLPGEKPMTRADATAMNRLCQWIVGEDAAVINYHGLRPADIDALACLAAKVEGFAEKSK